MTITTDSTTGTDITTANIGQLMDSEMTLGAAFEHTSDEGAHLFLGVEGGHGTTIRMHKTAERLIIAELLRRMADKIDPR